MRAIIGGHAVELTDLLGVGGEACVYRVGGLAVKVYHPGAPDVEHKLAKVQSYPAPVPAELVAPLSVVTDAHGKSIGFTMPLVSEAEPIGRLTQRKWREGAVPGERVMRVFARLHDALTRVHAAGIVYGDFNDANVLFTPDDRVWLIDADSVQFGAHLCRVAHEKYLDPRLYGRDLTRGACFDAGTDWYAFCVMLFSALTYVHPFGGIHPQHATMLRRAEARQSVFQRGVTYPKAGVPYAVLPDDLLHWLEEVFERDRREALPARLLQLRFTRCTCGVEHARTRCPACAAVGTAARRDAVVSHGKCRARTVFATRGRILAATVQGGLRYVYEQDGEVRREDGTRVLGEPAAPGLRFAIQGAATWAGLGSVLVRVEGGELRERSATGVFDGESAFDASESGCWRLEHEWLVEAGSGARLGKVYPGQSWLRAGARLGFGLWRAGRHVHHFLFRAGRPGLTDVALPPLAGRLTDCHAVCDEGHVLVVRTVEERGAVTRALDLVDETGRVLASASGAPDVRMLASPQGQALCGGRVLCATEQGLLAVAADGGALVEGTLFADTEPFVEAGATILPGPGGSVFVVTGDRISQLELA